MVKHTWPNHGCNRPGPWSSRLSPQSPHRPSPESDRTYRSTDSWSPWAAARSHAGGQGAGRDGEVDPVTQQLYSYYYIAIVVNMSRVYYLIKSWFPSSLPLCSSPRVQANMLAMGLVLVGLPSITKTEMFYI
jgi:hypothetical protein